VKRAYFCYPLAPGLIEATAKFAQAAYEEGVEHVVNMSQIAANNERSSSHAAQNHFLSERVLDRWSQQYRNKNDTENDRQSFTVVHIRPTFFAEWFLYTTFQEAIAARLVRTSFSTTGKHAPIAGEDIARVVAALLTSANTAEHAGKVYELYGAAEYTFPQIFHLIGQTLSIGEVKYQQIPVNAFYHYMANHPSTHGEAEFLAQHLTEVAEDHKNGLFAGTNDVVRELTGREPMTLQEWVEKNREKFHVIAASAKQSQSAAGDMEVESKDQRA